MVEIPSYLTKSRASHNIDYESIKDELSQIEQFEDPDQEVEAESAFETIKSKLSYFFNWLTEPSDLSEPSKRRHKDTFGSSLSIFYSE